MEGLRPRRQTAEDDTARNGVPAPVLPPCPTPGIRSDPSFRIPGQPFSRRPASPLPRVTGNASEIAPCNRCGGSLRLALSQMPRGNGGRSEIQRRGTLTMRIFRFLVGARSGPIKPGVWTTPTRRCARISYAVRPALPTTGFASLSMSRSAHSERDSRYCGCAWPTRHRPCKYQIDFQIP
jgi:hypothetical protein